MIMNEYILRDLCNIPPDNRISFISRPYYKTGNYFGECIFIWKENANLKAASFMDVLGDGINPRHFDFLGWVHPALAIDNPTLGQMVDFIQVNFVEAK